MEEFAFTKKLVQPPTKGAFLRTSSNEGWDGEEKC